MKIRLDVIDLDPTNPKQKDRIKRLENSIKAVGQIEPVKLRIKSADGKRRFDMVSGHHRYWALEKLRRKTIDAEIEGMSEDDMEKHRSIAAAFDNREDPDIVKANKMLDSLNGGEATEEKIRNLKEEYGYDSTSAIKGLLAFARFVDKHSPKRLPGDLEGIGWRHFQSSAPLVDYPKNRLGLLQEASKSNASRNVIKNKAKAILHALEEAEEARQREELEIAKRREMEAEVIKTSVPAKDKKGRLKTPEAIQAEAEAKVSTSRSKKIKEESWEDKPSQKAVLDGLIAIKRNAPKWAEVVAVGKFPPEASNKLNGLVDEAIESLEGFRKVL